eukprot:6586097-Pyramimonas_sp.AAC.1
MSARKRAALGKGIFDETDPTDPATARRVLEERRLARQAQPPASLEVNSDSSMTTTGLATSESLIMIQKLQQEIEAHE